MPMHYAGVRRVDALMRDVFIRDTMLRGSDGRCRCADSQCETRGRAMRHAPCATRNGQCADVRYETHSRWAMCGCAICADARCATPIVGFDAQCWCVMRNVQRAAR